MKTKLMKLIPLGLLLLISAGSASAQNALPDPHNESCWSSFAALRACQLQAYDQAQDYSQRCTSYPEYQCFDYYHPQQKDVAKRDKKNSSKTASATANSGAASYADNERSSAR